MPIYSPLSSSKPYAWPFSGGFDSKNTALIVVDMQYDFLSDQGYFASLGEDITHVRGCIQPNIEVLQAARKLGFMTIFTRESHRSQLVDLAANKNIRARGTGAAIGSRGPLGRFLVRGEKGCDIIEELYPTENEIVVDKPGNGAFYATDLDHILRVNHIKHLVITGITTDVCVSSTLREANDRGFDCLVIEDCCGAATPEAHQAVFDSMLGEGGIFGAFCQSGEFLESLEQKIMRIAGGS